jgi:hypothetical protein
MARRQRKFEPLSKADFDLSPGESYEEIVDRLSPEGRSDKRRVFFEEFLARRLFSMVSNRLIAWVDDLEPGQEQEQIRFAGTMLFSMTYGIGREWPGMPTELKLATVARWRMLVIALQRSEGDTRKAFDRCIDAGLRALLLEILGRSIGRSDPEGLSKEKSVVEWEATIAKLWKRPRRGGKPSVTEETKSQILSELEHDRNFARVGRKFGVSDVTVGRIAKQADKPIPAGPTGNVVISNEKRTEVVEALKRLRNFRAVAREVGGISHVTVAKIAKEYEITSKIAKPSSKAMKYRHDARWLKTSRRSPAPN